MMQALRNKRTIIFWIVIVTVIPGLILLYGKFSGISKNDPDIVARVGDGTITRTEFNQAYQSALDSYYSVNPDGPTSDETQHLQDQVLNSLVDDAILEQTAKRMGLSVPTEELAAAFRRQSIFLDKSGNFDQKSYFKFLDEKHMTADQFESLQRDQILLQKVRQALLDGVLFTNDEVEHYASLLGRDLKADYVSLDRSQFEKQLAPSESDLRDYYEGTRSQYDHAERIKIRHLFLAGLPGGGYQDPDKIKKTLEDYRSQVIDGKSKFQDLAKKYSQDDGSKNQGGEIGWVEKGELGRMGIPEDVEKEFFDLKPGEVTKPFKLQGGYDIAQVEEHQKAYQSLFPEVRSKVLKEYLREKSIQKTFGISERLTQGLKDQEPLSKIAKDLGLEVKSTEWFNRKKGIPLLKDSEGAAAQLSSLYPRQWKGPLLIGQKEYFFQITDAREDKMPATLSDEDRAMFTQQMIHERQQTWLREFLDAQKKKLDVKTFLNA